MTAGIASRNAYRVADARSYPMNRPPEMVAPERLTPGMSASAWANPKAMPSRTVRFSMVLRLAPTRSATPRTMPNVISVNETSHRLRAVVSMASANVSPRIPMGIVPMITYQPIRASSSERRALLVRDRVQVLMIRQMSCRK